MTNPISFVKLVFMPFAEFVSVAVLDPSIKAERFFRVSE